MKIYSQVKSLYSLRSKVVHAGDRDVLWQDVNTLQRLTEVVFWVVIKRCDLLMGKQAFEASLSEASHGVKWAYAGDESDAFQDSD